MHVVVRLPWQVEVEHVADVGNVEAARRHVARRQQLDVAGAELVQRLHAALLVHVAVQRAGVEAVLGQALEQNGHIALAIAEDDRVLDTFTANELAQRVALGPILAVLAVAETLGDGLRSSGGLGHLDAHRIAQELVNEAGDLGRHGGREEQRLALRRQQLADLLDVRDEAHVEHAVGLVDDEDLDAHQHQPAALEEIEHAAWGGDQHVDAAIELPGLVLHRDAANEQRHVELVIDAVFLEALRALRGELARRRQDQRARHSGPGSPRLQAGDHRQHERGSLARAGLGDAEHVAARNGDRDCMGLDRRRRGVTGRLDGGQHLGAEPELSERCRFQPSKSPTASSSPQARLRAQAAGSRRAQGEIDA